MENILNDWGLFLNDVGNSSSSSYKKSILEKYKDNENIKKILVATLHPYIKYNVTEKSLLTTPFDVSKVNPFALYNDIFELLDALNDRKITGHEALHTILFYALKWDCNDLMMRIMKRNLGLRIGEDLINDVMPGLIPTFPVQLGELWEDALAKNKVDFSIQEWVYSHKLDGLRCLGIIEPNGEVYIKTRGGIKYETLQVLVDELKASGLKGVVFDGEFCIIDEDGNEDYQAAMKVYNKKSEDKKGYVQIPNPQFMAFDILTYDEFMIAKGKTPFKQRYQTLNYIINNIPSLKHFKVVEQLPIESEEHLAELMLEAEKKKWEGLYIKRNDVGYEGDRSFDQLKVKIFQDMELMICGHEIGPFKAVIDGQQKTIETLLKVFVDFNGNKEVKVGSGFSLEERNRYALNPELLDNAEMTIKHGGITKPEKGKLASLRWPIKKHIWENGKRDA